jgi:hypothetical protein
MSISYVNFKGIIHTPNPKENEKKIKVSTLGELHEKMKKEKKLLYSIISKKSGEINQKFLTDKKINDISKFYEEIKNIQSLYLFLSEGLK